ncbi:hypothetical protein BBJ28_00015977 [Nothophytophthora sp. Chile5]|nr:hypothetical protein BBJ28_00015977 [Nothophytophthora sp. Chile5]
MYVDLLLIICSRYPVLVFLSTGGTTTASASRATRKRRRSANGSETPPAAVVTAPPSSGVHSRLFFFVLCEARDDSEKDGRVQLRFLNVLDFPLSARASDAVAPAATLQAFPTDGPHVLLFDRCSKVAALLKLRRAGRGSDSQGFFFWKEQVDVASGVRNDSSMSTEVLSCIYVSETHSTRPHLLIHSRLRQVSTDMYETLLIVLIASNCISRLPLLLCLLRRNERHIWSVCPTDEQQDALSTGAMTRICRYLPTFSSTNMGNERSLSLEQVSCCCFISESSDWDFTTASASDPGRSIAWPSEVTTRPKRVELTASTLLVVSSTSNTVYVYTNGILLVSFVLPVAPAEICCLSDDSGDQCYKLAVRCEDVDRSFFLLAFASKRQHASMELLLSTSTTTQVLLLNDVPAVVNTEDGLIKEGGRENPDDGQLVKRSVLVVQQPGAAESKLVSYRLRLREQKKSKQSSRTLKRKSSGDKASLTTSEGAAKTPFLYIERTQKASSRGKSSLDQLDESGGGAADSSAASHAQLGKLAESLATRLDKGLQELERMQLVVDDKHALTQQLNQLVLQQWWQSRQQTDTATDFVRLVSRRGNNDGLAESRGLVDMQVIVSTPSTTPTVGSVNTTEAEPPTPRCDVVLKSKVTLESFRVTEYVPSSSLVRVEVVLRNESAASLANAFRPHLRLLQKVLRAMRLEILTIQRRATVSTPNDTDPKASKQSVADEEDHVDSPPGRSIRAHCRLMQRDTDLLVLRLLQTLQKRVNFHTMWFDTAATDHEGPEA